MNVQELTEITLTTECFCTVYDEDDNKQPATDCFGCYDDELAYLAEKLGEWLTANEWTDETIIRVQFSGVSWQRVAGYGDITVDDILEFLTLNGDFRIVFTLTPDNKTLTARRYSHDEPMGTGLITFTRSPLTNCAYCGDPAECSQLDGQEICQHCKEWRTN
jgi:hypothetical protein